MTELQNLKEELKQLKARETEIKNKIKELEANNKEQMIEIPVVRLSAEKGIEAVAEAIENLSLKQLKYVVKSNGLDSFKVSTSYKEDKLKAFILERTKAKQQMGMGFRYYSK